MKQIMRLLIGVFLMTSAVFAQAYPACSGSAVAACSSITTQSVCLKSFVESKSTTCPTQYCNSSTNYCTNRPYSCNDLEACATCKGPNVQCTWKNGTCTDGGGQCQ